MIIQQAEIGIREMPGPVRDNLCSGLFKGIMEIRQDPQYAELYQRYLEEEREKSRKRTTIAG